MKSSIFLLSAASWKMKASLEKLNFKYPNKKTYSIT